MIEVGEYVRINKDFRTSCVGIGKVVNKNQDAIYVKMSNNNLPIYFNADSIVNHKTSLIDLIKEGDYVNGIEIITHNGQKGFYDEDMGECSFYCIDDIKIKTILTKEQYETNCYKVKEEKWKI